MKERKGSGGGGNGPILSRYNFIRPLECRKHVLCVLILYDQTQFYIHFHCITTHYLLNKIYFFVFSEIPIRIQV